ncbi:arfaptin-2 [Culicoides brevitarsis]|uniref:arfaptin-2 n=1 Tax=Culicoides brevitarsis TaxID=469753 RepID=UPI00307C240F
MNSTLNIHTNPLSNMSVGSDRPSIHEMLKDEPSMSESKSSVFSGTEVKSYKHPTTLPGLRSVGPSSSSAAAAAGNAATTPNNASSHNTPSSAVGTPASVVSPFSPSSQNGSDSAFFKNGASKIDTIKTWSISTYKCTRQLMMERLGKTSRTVDTELEAQIELLRETQRKYLSILRLSRAFSSHFQHCVQTQHALAEAFSDLAQKSPELQEEFMYNSETQRNLTKNGELLLGALNFFVSSVNTLCNKTIEDTLLTIRQYETARIEYDAYKNDLEVARPEVSSPAAEEAQKNFSKHKEQYEKLRADVAVKMQFLDENRVKVMHKQLLLLHNAVAAYFSGNATALEGTLKQFNIKSPNSTSSSWLEQ